MRVLAGSEDAVLGRVVQFSHRLCTFLHTVPRYSVSFVLCEWVFFLSFICDLLICYFLYMRVKQPCEKTEIAPVILAEITE